MNTRRQFLITAPMGIVGAAVACRGAEQTATTSTPPTTPGAPPAFGTGPVTGPPVSPSTFAEAERLAQVTMSAGERQMAAASWQRTMAPPFERRVGPRKVALDSNVAPATRDGATPLHWAAYRDDVAIADLLIRAGARANVADDLGATPLHVACTNRSGSMVERLLSVDANANANANATLLSGETALMTCARAGDARAVKALLARGADVNAKEHEHQQTALMWAAAQRHPDVVQLLVEARADVRARSLSYAQTVVGERRSGRDAKS